MPKLARDVSHDRLVRFLRRHGWPIVREGAKHTIVERAGQQVSVPRHDQIKTGTVAGILKQCGLQGVEGL